MAVSRTVARSDEAREQQQPPRGGRFFLALANVVLWIGLPSLWLLGAWAIGPLVPGAFSLLLIPVALAGMSVSMVLFGSYLMRVAAKWGLAESPRLVRRGSMRRTRRQLEVRRPAESRPLSPRDRVLVTLLSAAMVVIAVGLITAVPLGMIWIASQLSSTSSPGIFPYFVVAAGIALGALIALRLLAVLHRWHSAITGRLASSRRQTTGWLKSLGDSEWERDSGALVERVVVITVLLGVVAFVIWLVLFVDPSQLVPQLQPAG